MRIAETRNPTTMRPYLFFLSAIFAFQATAQNIAVSPAELDFGNVIYNQKDSLFVEVTNLTNAEITLTELRFFDVYETTPFYTDVAPTSMPPLGTEGFYVVFDPRHNIQHNSELVIRTSGNRGSVSVDLQGSCTYPLDYYGSTFDLMDEALESELKSITGAGYIQHGYDAARDEMFMFIDNQKVNGQGSAQNKLTRVYIGTDAVGYTGRSDLFNNYNVNTEHTFPQGFFNSNLPMKTDLHHLYPTDVNANSIRGNLRFGNVTGNVDWQQGGSKRGSDETGAVVFEPRDEHKGAAARAVLYFVTRYQNYGGHLSELMETTLRAWSSAYPPTQAEKTRNGDIADYQNNRNPFADYPQFINRIYSFRLDQNRPNVGVLKISDESIDFGQVTAAGDQQPFNLALTNVGERFMAISDIALSGSSVFSLVGDAPGVINPGESVSIRIAVDASALEGVASGELSFSAANSPVTLTVVAEGVSGISDRQSANVILAPNPAKDYFRLIGDLPAVSSIEIYDSLGRRCKAYGQPTDHHDLGDLAPGVYTVHIGFADGGFSAVHLAVGR